MSSEWPDLPARPLGHCGYCGKAVYTNAKWYVVDTIIGCVRLCDACGEKETFARTSTFQHWQFGTANPKTWRKARQSGGGKKRG